jgi:cell division transport system permease protein
MNDVGNRTPPPTGIRRLPQAEAGAPAVVPQRPAVRPIPAPPPPRARVPQPGDQRPQQAQRASQKPARGRAQAGAPVVPQQSVAGKALILVIAIMCYLACLSAGFLTLVSAAATDWQNDVSREVTIQVKPLDGVAMEPRLQKALSLARAAQGVADVRLVTEEESRKLVEPWLGNGIDISQLPVPRLIVLTLADPANTTLAGLEAALNRDVKGAVLDNHAMWSARLRTMANTMVAAGVVVLLLVLVSMTLSVVFATRAATAGNRTVIEVLHFVGAEDRFIAREFQRHFLVLGLKGGAFGGLAAMASFLIAGWITREDAGTAIADQTQALFGGLTIGWAGYLATFGIAIVVAALTAATSRMTVRSQLDHLE